MIPWAMHAYIYVYDPAKPNKRMYIYLINQTMSMV